MAYTHEPLVCDDVEESRCRDEPARKQSRVHVLVGLAISFGAACLLLTAQHARVKPVQHMKTSGVTRFVSMTRLDEGWKDEWLEDCMFGLADGDARSAGLYTGRYCNNPTRKCVAIKNHAKFCEDSYESLVKGKWTPWTVAPRPNSGNAYFDTIYMCATKGRWGSAPIWLSPTGGSAASNCQFFFNDAAKYNEDSEPAADPDEPVASPVCESKDFGKGNLKDMWVEECRKGLTEGDARSEGLYSGRYCKGSNMNCVAIKNHDKFCEDSYDFLIEGKWTPWTVVPRPNSADAYFTMIQMCAMKGRWGSAPIWLSPTGGYAASSCPFFFNDAAQYNGDPEPAAPDEPVAPPTGELEEIGQGLCMSSKDRTYSWRWASEEGDRAQCKQSCATNDNCRGMEHGEWGNKCMLVFDAGFESATMVHKTGTAVGPVAKTNPDSHKKATCWGKTS